MHDQTEGHGGTVYDVTNPMHPQAHPAIFSAKKLFMQSDVDESR